VRPAAVVLGCVLAAGVLVIDPDGWSPFGPSKWLAVTVSALLGALLAFVGRGAGHRTVRVARRAILAWAAFLAWVVVAAAFGVDPRLAWVGTPQRHFGALTWMLCALMFVVGQRLDDDGDARVVVGSAALVCGIAGVWSVAELCGWQPVALASSDRLVGPTGSAAYLGAAMALLVPLSVGIAADAQWSLRARRLAALCAASGLVALIGSGARAAWVGAAAAAVLLVAARRRQVGARVSVTRRWRLGAGVGAAAALVVGLAVLTGTAGRVPAAFTSGQPGGLSRLAEWDVAARVVWDHPLTGVGPEGYRVVFGRAVDAGYQRRYGRAVLPDRAHDSLLDVAVTTGLPGLAVYLAVLATVGRFVWRALRRAPPWLAGVAVGAAAYNVGQLLLFPLAEIEPGMWLLVGLLCARVVRDEETVALPVPRGAQVALAAAAGVALVAGVRSVGADRHTRVALDDAGSGRYTAGVAAAAAAVSWDPTDIVVRLNAAEVDAAGASPADVHRALGQISAGLAVSGHDPVLGEEGGALRIELAELTGRDADWRSAQADLRALAGRDPRNPQVLLQLGVADAAVGDNAEALAEWTSAADLAPGDSAPDSNLAVLYARLGDRSAAQRAALAALARDPSDAQARAVLAQLSPNP